MNLSYTQATNEDIETLITIARSTLGRNTYSPITSETEWKEELSHASIFIIKHEGNVLGLISYEIKNEGHAYISDLIILPKFQGRGLAKSAMGHILEQLKNIPRIDLVVHPENIAAVNLYTSFGFIVESRKENHFNDNEPRLVMVLKK